MLPSVALALTLAFGGCGTPAPVGPTPFPRDAGVSPSDRAAVTDGPLDPAADEDGDGLCNGTEGQLQTNPQAVDSDDDGLVDSFEYAINSDPRNLRSPALGDRLEFREGDATPLRVEHLLDWRGEGETLLGAVQDGANALTGEAASAWVTPSVEAIEANPSAFVRDLAGPRFVGVLGRAWLRWQVSLSPAAARPALGCRRAYELFFTVKAEGGNAIVLRRLVLSVTPGAVDGGARWPRVSPEGFCLPARCL